MVQIPTQLLLGNRYAEVEAWCRDYSGQLSAVDVAEALRGLSREDFAFLRGAMNRPNGQGGTKGVLIRGTVISKVLHEITETTDAERLGVAVSRAERLIVFATAVPEARRVALADFVDQLQTGQLAVFNSTELTVDALQLSAVQAASTGDMAGLLGILKRCPDLRSGFGKRDRDPRIRCLIRSKEAAIGIAVVSKLTDETLRNHAFLEPNIASCTVEIAGKKVQLSPAAGHQIARLVSS
jgi:hypothetical protein